MKSTTETKQSSDQMRLHKSFQKVPAKFVECVGGRLALSKMEADIVTEKTEDRKKLEDLAVQGIISKELEHALISFKERYYRFATSELKQTKAALPDIVRALKIMIHDAREALRGNDGSKQDTILLLREEHKAPPGVDEEGNTVILHEFRVKSHGLEHCVVIYTRTPAAVVRADLVPCSVDDLLAWVDYDLQEVNSIFRRVVWQQERLDRASKPRLEYI